MSQYGVPNTAKKLGEHFFLILKIQIRGKVSGMFFHTVNDDTPYLFKISLSFSNSVGLTQKCVRNSAKQNKVSS
jgi:hypothetical protein